MSRTRVIELMRLATAFFPHVVGAGYESRTRPSAVAGQRLRQSAKPACFWKKQGQAPWDWLLFLREFMVPREGKLKKVPVPGSEAHVGGRCGI